MSEIISLFQLPRRPPLAPLPGLQSSGLQSAGLQTSGLQSSGLQSAPKLIDETFESRIEQLELTPPLKTAPPLEIGDFSPESAPAAGGVKMLLTAETDARCGYAVRFGRRRVEAELVSPYAPPQHPTFHPNTPPPLTPPP